MGAVHVLWFAEILHEIHVQNFMIEEFCAAKFWENDY